MFWLNTKKIWAKPYGIIVQFDPKTHYSFLLNKTKNRNPMKKQYRTNI